MASGILQNRMIPGAFLVLEDEPHAASSLARILSRWRPTRTAGSLREARHWLELPDISWTGLIADIGLPDGSGFEIVDLARARWPLLPVLMLTGHYDRQSINHAHAVRAEYLCKPPEEDALLGFARRALTFERVPEQRLALLVDDLARRSGLSPRETEVVAAAVARVPRRQLLDQLDVTDNTLKSQVRSVLHKTRQESLDALTRGLLMEALGGSALLGQPQTPNYDVDE